MIIDNSRKDFGNPINVLKHGNSKQIDTDVFIPLYEHLSKARLDNDAIIERINKSYISNEIKNLGHMTNQKGRIWEGYVQTEIRKFMITNMHLKYFDMQQDQKKIIHMSNGSALIKENDKLITEIDCLLKYHNHPIIIEIKSSIRKSSGTGWGSGHYQFKMKIAKEIFSNYDEPFFLKIRASEDDHGVGLTSRFLDHRKIVMPHSPMLTGLKYELGEVRFKGISRR